MCTLISKKEKAHALSKGKDFRGDFIKLKKYIGGGKKWAITLRAFTSALL